MEGFVGDVGDLMKLVMAKEGIRTIEHVDEKLAHELADCLWCILVLSEKYGVDIEQSFLKTMGELEKRIAEEKC
jgi:NTP pyrophosphatase (non-canonical NTP hydrolase)